MSTGRGWPTSMFEPKSSLATNNAYAKTNAPAGDGGHEPAALGSQSMASPQSAVPTCDKISPATANAPTANTSTATSTARSTVAPTADMPTTNPPTMTVAAANSPANAVNTARQSAFDQQLSFFPTYQPTTVTIQGTATLAQPLPDAFTAQRLNYLESSLSCLRDEVRDLQRSGRTAARTRKRK